jgi:hypothetical protein
VRRFFWKRDGGGHILEALKFMASNSESEPYKLTLSKRGQPSRWIKVGVIAAATALAGGLAAAWWYRKTLKTLRQTGEMNDNPQFGIPFDDTRDGS